MIDDRSELRARLRAARREADRHGGPAAAGAVADTLAAHLHGAVVGAGAGHAVADGVGPLTGPLTGPVAGYVAGDGELDPTPALAVLASLGAVIVYPRIDGDHMSFHVAQRSALVAGPVGLVQPVADAPTVAADALALVLCPLVGFDGAGTRLGRGRAYYDRTFAFLLDDERPRRPVLVGVAHDVQRVETLPTLPHDVVLDAVITPRTVVGDLAAAIAAAMAP